MGTLESTGQPKIKGYRELSTDEVALINKIKEHGEQTRALVQEVSAFVENREEDIQPMATSDGRWVSIAMTHLQQGHMALTRAVASPTSF